MKTQNERPKGRAFFRIRFVLILALTSFLMGKQANAQVNVSVNIVAQPLWGPVGYDYALYYYLPEVEVYYYVPTAKFIYWSSGRWVFSAYLPAVYRIDLYRTYKVVLNSPRPYIRHGIYLKKFGKYKKYKGKQIVIRDSRNSKYYVVKGHPYHYKVKTVKSQGPVKIKPGGTKSNSAKGNGSKGNGPRGNGSKGKKKGN